MRRRRQEVKTPLLLLLGSPWSADEGERARVSRLVRYTAVPSASETPPAVKATCGRLVERREEVVVGTAAPSWRTGLAGAAREIAKAQKRVAWFAGSRQRRDEEASDASASG